MAHRPFELIQRQSACCYRYLVIARALSFRIRQQAGSG